MNMSKKIVYLLIVFFVFLGCNINVFADDELVCEYLSTNATVELKMKFSLEKGAVKLKVTPKYKKDQTGAEEENTIYGKDVKIINFVDYEDAKLTEEEAMYMYSRDRNIHPRSFLMNSDDGKGSLFWCPTDLHFKTKTYKDNDNWIEIRIYRGTEKDNGVGSRGAELPLKSGEQQQFSLKTINQEPNRECRRIIKTSEGAEKQTSLYYTSDNDGKISYFINRSNYKVTSFENLTEADFSKSCPSVSVKCNNDDKKYEYKCVVKKVDDTNLSDEEKEQVESEETDSVLDDMDGAQEIIDHFKESTKVTKKECSDGYRLQNGECVEDKIVGDNFCDEDSVQKILKVAGIILIIAKIVIPLALIVVCSIDLFHAVVGKDEKALMKGLKTLALRVGLGVFIFFVPSIVKWVFNLYYDSVGETSNNQCISCVLDISQCSNS